MIPRTQIMQLNSDSDDYGEEDDSKIFRDDLDEDILEDEGVVKQDDDDDDDDEDGEDPDQLDADGQPTNSWQERRQIMNAERDRKSAAIRAKLSWEEKFEDDPLRADTPTKTLEEEIEAYDKIFVAISEVSGNDMLSMRSRAWIHHMQWARRSALLPDVSAKIKWEYTQLSSDSTVPVGQVIGIKANTSAEVRQLLESEPLGVTGGVTPWKLFEFNQFHHDNTTWDLHDPKLFIGYDSESKSSEVYSKHEEAHQDYHISGGRQLTDSKLLDNNGGSVLVQQPVLNHKRAVLMGRLIACDDESSSNDATLIVFNAKTNADAERYISQDPLMKVKSMYDKKRSFISTANVQDIDGLNHMMARTFGQKSVLDQIHYMDPEDLLDLEVEELPGLPDHAAENMNVLKALDALDINYRYTRLTMTERYGGLTAAEGYALKWNKKLEATQKIRMSSAVDQESVDEESLAAASSEDDSGSSADASND